VVELDDDAPATPGATSSPAAATDTSSAATPTARIPAILFMSKPPVWKPNPFAGSAPDTRGTLEQVLVRGAH